MSDPQTNPRKQTYARDTESSSTLPTRFRYPLSPHKDSSQQFWDKDEHFRWIDSNTPCKPIMKPSKSKKGTLTLKEERKAFVQVREKLAEDLVRRIDQKVMRGKLATATSTTGGIKLEWSTRLRTAAGKAHWTRVKCPSDRNEEQHNLKIELSSKIITNEGGSGFCRSDK